MENVKVSDLVIVAVTLTLCGLLFMYVRENAGNSWAVISSLLTIVSGYLSIHLKKQLTKGSDEPRE
jgi:uncharacterized membrane protein